MRTKFFCLNSKHNFFLLRSNIYIHICTCAVNLSKIHVVIKNMLYIIYTFHNYDLLFLQHIGSDWPFPDRATVYTIINEKHFNKQE